MFGKDAVFFVSDRETQAKAGSPEVMKSVNNIWKLPLTGEPPRQITHHTSGSLFWPSISADGRTIVYEENFGLWKLDVSNGHGQPVEVKIDIVTDDRENNLETKTISSEADAYHLSPSGKRAVIAVEGDLFTIATDKGEPKRLTRDAGGPGKRRRNGARTANGSRSSPTRAAGRKSGSATRTANTKRRFPTWTRKRRRRSGRRIPRPCSTRPATRSSTSTPSTAARRTCSASGEVIDFGGVAISRPQWTPDGKWVSLYQSRRHVAAARLRRSRQRRAGQADHRPRKLQRHRTPNGHPTVNTSFTSPAWTSATSAPQTATTRPRFTRFRSGRRISRRPKKAWTARPKRGLRTTGRGSGRVGGTSGDDESPGRGKPAKVEVKIDFDHLDRRVKQITTTGDRISGMTLAPDGKTVAFVTSGVEGGRPVNSIWTADDRWRTHHAGHAIGHAEPRGGDAAHPFAASGSAASPACNMQRTGGRSTTARAGAFMPFRSAAAARRRPAAGWRPRLPAAARVAEAARPTAAGPDERTGGRPDGSISP